MEGARSDTGRKAKLPQPARNGTFPHGSPTGWALSLAAVRGTVFDEWFPRKRGLEQTFRRMGLNRWTVSLEARL